MSRKSNASRENGKKSKGPITPEGKERSSRNSLKHGLTADHAVLLASEDPVEFARLRQRFYDEWRPTTITEQCLVETMLASQWRTLRLGAFEVAMIDSESARRRPEFDKVFTDPPAVLVSGGTYVKLCNETAAPGVLSRYRTRNNREFRACANLLQQLRAGRPQPEPNPPDLHPGAQSSSLDPDLPNPEEIAASRPAGDYTQTIYYFRSASFPTNPSTLKLRSEEPVLLHMTA